MPVAAAPRLALAPAAAVARWVAAEDLVDSDAHEVPVAVWLEQLLRGGGGAGGGARWGGGGRWGACAVHAAPWWRWSPLPNAHHPPLHAAVPPRATLPHAAPRRAYLRGSRLPLSLPRAPRLQRPQYGGLAVRRLVLDVEHVDAHALEGPHPQDGKLLRRRRAQPSARRQWGGRAGRRGGGAHERLDVDVDVVDRAHARQVVGKQSRRRDELGAHMAAVEGAG